MDGADEVHLDNDRIVHIKEMSNGCYVEMYEYDENPGTQSHPPTDHHARVNGQFLLKAETPFRNIEMLPVSSDLKVRLAEVVENGAEWLDDGAGADKEWWDDTTRADKLMKYVSSNWRDDASGILRDVTEELVEQEVMMCNRTGDLFTLGEWGYTDGAYVATVEADEANRCGNCGAPKSEFQKCIRSSRRTRVPNRYKCTNCGNTTEGITTG